MPTFDIVVCAENNTFMVWQAMLFHYSCIRHMQRAPIIVVHKNDEPLLKGFRQIRDSGGIVQIAPNYRCVGGVNYPPRNTAATLRHVQSEARFLVLCDPDMIFMQPVPFDDPAPTDRQISFDHLGYLVPDHPDSRPVLAEVCARAGVSLAKLHERPISGGVPHVMPRSLQRPFSDEWLHCLE